MTESYHIYFDNGTVILCSPEFPPPRAKQEPLLAFFHFPCHADSAMPHGALWGAVSAGLPQEQVLGIARH